MRIAAVGSRHLLSGYSGIERGLAQFAPLIVADGRHTLTVYGGPPPPGVTPSSHCGVGLAVAPHLPGKHLESLSRSAAATVMAVRAGADLVHFQHQGPGIFSAVTRTLGIPNVVTVCGLDWQRKKWSPAAKRAIRAAEQAAVRYADGIAVLSRRIQAYFLDQYGRETCYIPNGLPDIKPPDSLPTLERFGLTPDGYVLFAGRLVPEKGCHDLLAAWRRTRLDLPLVIAGTGPAGDPYGEQLRQEADPTRVAFIGHLDQTAMLEVMAGCKLLVLPSYIEGMSNALLEAVALQRPVLTSDIAENVEVLDGQGMTFPVGDVDALRAALTELLTAPGRLQRMQSDLARTAPYRPRWTDVARLHVDLYERSAASRDAAAMKKYSVP
jgi:glycosyltransferase involved in cell wall biosynthesis